MFNTKLKIQLSDWYDIQNLIDSYELIRREKLNLKVKVCVASMLLKHFFFLIRRRTNWPNDLFCSMYTTYSATEKSPNIYKKIIDISWVIPLIFKDVRKETELQYIHKYIFMSNCSIKLEGNQSTSSSRMIAAVKTYHNTSKSVTCLLLESVSGLIYPYQFKQLKSNYHNMGQKSLCFSFVLFSFFWY